MVLYFDLNLPFLEKPDVPAAENSSRKAARLKAVVKAMELGYTSVAYDRSVRGVMSDSDRCTIPPFPLSSLLKVAPTLSSAVSFHRELLGVPLNSPFHQYTRLTVVVDSAASAAALNTGNPLLRTYDLVAAKPLNQMAFDQACQFSEVDLIAIDFSQKLPFRLKPSMVEAAIKRGVHFEITYSHLIADVQVRRQMLSDAKLLVAWTRGKNIILSSAASTVNELRGPCDVANLSVFLLGLSVERAKAAISGNCRSLVASALRKKHCYKEAIRIERISPYKQVDSNCLWFGDWNDWDPISSGEGDLPPLDDVAKFFSAASMLPKESTAVDSVSVADRMPFKRAGENLLSLGDNATFFSLHKELGSSTADNEVPSSATIKVPQQDRLGEVPVADRIPLAVTQFGHQISGCEGNLVSPCGMETVFSGEKDSDPSVIDNKAHESLTRLHMDFDEAGMPSNDILSKDCIFTSEGNLVSTGGGLTLLTAATDIEQSDICMRDHESSDAPSVVSVTTKAPRNDTDIVECIPCVTCDLNSFSDNGTFFTTPIVMDMPKEQTTLGAQEQEQSIPTLSACGKALQNGFAKPGQSEQGENVVPFFDDVLLMESFDEMKEQDQGKIALVETNAPFKDIIVITGDEEGNGSAAAYGTTPHGHKSVKRRCKERSSYPAFPFPVKGILKPMLFKKRPWQLKRPT